MADIELEKKIVAGIRAAVAERGADYVYPDEWRGTGGGCFYYNEDGTPSCLVGLAIDKAGLTDHVWNKRAKVGAHDLLESMIPGIDTRLGVAVEAAQGLQDDGATWGEALARFEEYVPEELR